MYPDRDTLSNVLRSGYMHGEKWRDRRREKHCLFSFSWINTTTQTWSLMLKSNDFQVMPEEKQHLVEENDADSVRKALRKSFIQWFYSFSFVFFCCCWSTLRWKSRNITKLNARSLGKPVSFVFPRVLALSVYYISKAPDLTMQY